ncbi:acyl-CoA thioesterase-1 [Marinoscillum furvescens DSM 4134]|uniref:Acyl-CoA thioesterase-1 n=2 Tax=Marinoscillum furvescens TaxID=1026 RepID=A0A3D9L6S5_MARFU|nr:acyl-CoA thioesterase-1 [Marinoscillum furvescens DSM 4134]
MICIQYWQHLLWILFLGACTSSHQNKQMQEETTTTTEEKVVVEESADREVLLFFGNSITAGYQLDVEDAFPALIQDRLDSMGYSYQVVNAGLSGETTAGGLNRIDWVLQTIPDVFVLELGANDGLRGLDLKVTKQNLMAIIDKVRTANPEVKILLTGMLVPPNMGEAYAEEFRNIFPAVAEEKNTALMPFILKDVAGEPELNLEDGIHPTEEGHKILAKNIWPYLKPLLEKK